MSPEANNTNMYYINITDDCVAVPSRPLPNHVSDYIPHRVNADT